MRAAVVGRGIGRLGDQECAAYAAALAYGFRVRIEKCVDKALAEWEQGDLESAMLHATNAVDGSASRTSGRSTTKQFKAFLRKHLDVLQVMSGAVTMDLTNSRFHQLPTIGGQDSPPDPDVVDVIWAAHRCAHGHGSEVPLLYELNTENLITVHVGEGATGLQLPLNIVPSLVAVAVLCRENRGLTGGGDSWLSWEHPGAGDFLPRREIFMVREWWGRKADFLAITNGPQSLFTVTPHGPWDISVAHEDLPITITTHFRQ